MTRPLRAVKAVTTALFWLALALVIAGAVLVVRGLGAGTGVGLGAGVVVLAVLCHLASVVLAFAVERQRFDGGTLGGAVRATLVSFFRTGRARRRPDSTR